MSEYIAVNKLNQKSFGTYLSVLAASAAILVGCTSKGEAAPPTSTETTATTPVPTTETPTIVPTETVTVTETAPSETEVPPVPPVGAVDCLVQKCIALTFDDGPGPYTNQLLDELAAHNVKATFFMVGTQVENYPDTVRRIRDEGHQLGNHSWNHDQLTTKGAAAAADDIHRTNDLIAETTGVTPEVMRPPYGSTNQSIINAVGMPEILWSVDPQDWKYRDSDYVREHVISNAHRGSIVLMHDIHKTTVNAVPGILDTLQSEGYQLVTIDTLLGSNLPAGKYSQQPGM